MPPMVSPTPTNRTEHRHWRRISALVFGGLILFFVGFFIGNQELPAGNGMQSISLNDDFSSFWSERYGFQILVYDKTTKEVRLVNKDEKIENVKLLVKTPLSDILFSTTSPSGVLYFALITKVPYMVVPPPAGGDAGFAPDMTIAYRYDPESEKLNTLFVGTELPTGSQYPTWLTSFTPDGNYARFALSGCNACDGGQTASIIVYVGDGFPPLRRPPSPYVYIVKVFGPALNFVFTSNSSYRYAEALPNPKEMGYLPGPVHEEQF